MQDKTMKLPPKALIVLAIVPLLIVVGCNSRHESSNTSSENTSVSSAPTSAMTNTSSATDTVTEAPTATENTYFQSDDAVNTFFENYNAVSNYPIDASSIVKGNIKTKASVSQGGVYMTLVDSATTNHVCVTIESKSTDETDEFIDACKSSLRALDTSLTNDDVQSLIDNELHVDGHGISDYEYDGKIVSFSVSSTTSYGATKPKMTIDW